MRSFGVIRIRISDPRSHGSHGSWCIKGTDESTLVTDSSASLMYHDLSDLGSLILIQITPKERTLNQFHFNLQLNIDFSPYGASLSVPDAVFSDTKSNRVSTIVYRTLHKVLRLRNEGSANDRSGSNIISATILPRPKNPLRREIKLVFNHTNQVLVI